MRVNKFVKAEGGGRAPLERLLQAIEMQEDAKREGEDWPIAKEYVHSQGSTNGMVEGNGGLLAHA
jgi:hypothetical protein